MSRIAVVGAGQAGLLAAHGFLRQGHEVSLYSDKSPEDFLTKARPTGTAARFEMALAFERELGLDHWRDLAPRGDGVHLTFCPKKGNQLVTLLGRLQEPFLAVDVRLQSATWMRDLDARGGEVHVENVSVERLDEIAGDNDLTVVAAGRGDIQRLFPRDERRSTYAAPQRFLAMVNVTGVDMRVPSASWFTPVKFNFFAPHGEAFWVPWYSKDGKPSWSLLFEAKEGGPLDRFRECRDAEATLRTAKEVIRDMTPWDYEWLRDAEPCDENSWLVGQFVPQVRQVVGTLPSGRHVMALGDTAHSLDPIGGQGANNGNKQARTLVSAVAERGDGPFDAAWMRDTFDRFWDRHRWIEQFDSILLEPLTNAGKMLLIAQYGSTARATDSSAQQRMADLFIENFNDPRTLTDAFVDPRKARAVLREVFGNPVTPLLRGGVGVARAQLRQALGRPALHPGT